MGLAAHKGLGAVQRIDQQEPAGDAERDPAGGGVLLGDHRNIAERLFEPGQDQRLALAIGLGDRALVVLDVHRHARAPKRQDDGAGRLDDIGESRPRIG